MAWPEKTLDDWRQLAEAASRTTSGSPFTTGYFFRGQADAGWPLRPTLLRHFRAGIKATEALKIEQQAFMDFSSQAHLHVRFDPNFVSARRMQWWAMMQHYGAPTRLLDWTNSMYVAAYFACVDFWDRDGAIWLADSTVVCAPVIAKFGEKLHMDERQLLQPDADHWLQLWWPEVRTDRMAMQQGLFTLCHNVLGDHERIIEDICQKRHESSGGVEVYRKVTIPKDLKPLFLRQLQSMNVRASALFPGMDGIGKSVTEMVRTHGLLSKPGS